MLDLALIITLAIFSFLGFVAGGAFYYMRQHNWPWNWGEQWWPFAVWGIFWVSMACFVVWQHFRVNLTPIMAILDLLFVFTASLPGIAFWQVYESNENRSASYPKRRQQAIKKAKIHRNGVKAEIVASESVPDGEE